MLSNTQFFLLGNENSYSNILHMYKIKFSLTSVEWANKLTYSSYYGSQKAESLLSKNGSNIYLFFIGNYYYLYFATLSVSTGSVVSTRYRSNTSANYLYGSALNNDYIIN